jgi:hypothetical protein
VLRVYLCPLQAVLPLPLLTASLPLSMHRHCYPATWLTLPYPGLSAQFKAQRLEEVQEEDEEEEDGETQFVPSVSNFEVIQEDMVEEVAEDVMLFDLDDDKNSNNRRRPASDLDAASPIQTPSPGSSPSSSTTSGTLSTRPLIHTPAARMQMLPAARSLHVSDAFFWRKLKGSQATKHKNQRSPQVYPPPVHTFSPGSLDGFFSDFSVELWASFVDQLKHEIEEALETHRWRQTASPDASIAASCRW